MIEAPSPIIDRKYLKPIDVAKKATTFGTGIKAFCLDKFVITKDLQQTRERIRTNLAERHSLEQIIKDIKGYTAGNLFCCKENRIPKEMTKAYLKMKQRRK